MRDPIGATKHNRHAPERSFSNADSPGDDVKTDELIRPEQSSFGTTRPETGPRSRWNQQLFTGLAHKGSFS